MSGVETPDLGRKVGGLSLGMWGVMLAGGVGVGLYLRRRNAAAAATTTTVTDNTDTAPGAGNLSVGYPSSNPYGAQPNDQSTAASAPTNNADWSVLAQRVLLGFGYDQTAVSAAIGNFLGGQPMTTAQTAMVNLAATRVGPAPEYVPPASSGTTTQPITGTTTPTPQPQPSRPAFPVPTGPGMWTRYNAAGQVVSRG